MLVLSKLFRRLMLEKLAAAHKAGKLRFFGEHAHLAGADAFAAFLAPLKKTKWFVYSKRPFSAPETVLAYLSRYTHRVAISNRRLIAADKKSVTFKYKDYRIERPGRYKTMTLDTAEFIRRFLTHVLPKGFHRIRHYGLLASGVRAENLATLRVLLAMAAPVSNASDAGKAGAPALGMLAQHLPLLRRPDAHHRDLRGKLPAENAGAGTGQDRYVMKSRAHAPPLRLPPAFAAAHRQATAGACPAAARRMRSKPRPASLMLAMPPRGTLTAHRWFAPHSSRGRPCCPHADGGVEILIALCSPGCPAPRAFLPRRLSDAGPRWRRGEVRHGQASETLHNC